MTGKIAEIELSSEEKDALKRFLSCPCDQVATYSSFWMPNRYHKERPLFVSLEEKGAVKLIDNEEEAILTWRGAELLKKWGLIKDYEDVILKCQQFVCLVRSEEDKWFI